MHIRPKHVKISALNEDLRSVILTRLNGWHLTGSPALSSLSSLDFDACACRAYDFPSKSIIMRQNRIMYLQAVDSFPSSAAFYPFQPPSDGLCDVRLRRIDGHTDRSTDCWSDRQTDKRMDWFLDYFKKKTMFSIQFIMYNGNKITLSWLILVESVTDRPTDGPVFW